MELHKDSKFYESWENFKNNNTYVNKVLDWKVKYDESENPVIRASRLLTDKVSDVMGGLFSKTELSETMTELVKIDPSFDQKDFLHDCETDIIPNILESIVRGDLEILKDWCFESTFNIIATPIKEARKAGMYLDSKILDIENIELAMGKVMELGAIKERVGDVLDDASKSDLAKKVTEELSRKAKGVSDTITDTSGKLGQSSAFQAISSTTTIIKKEMHNASIDNRVYRAPLQLRKRVQLDMSDSDRVVEPNTEATGRSLSIPPTKV